MMFFSVKLAVSIRATARESSGCNRDRANRMICSALLTCRLYEPDVSISRYTPVLCGTGDEQADRYVRSEEHTSELQSPCNLVCRLLLEKKKELSTNPLLWHSHSVPLRFAL